jgi:hypothetical protein
MELSESYCAVGIAKEKNREGCVVVAFKDITIRLPENLARKLADDILRNANYLWPIKDQDD